MPLSTLASFTTLIQQGLSSVRTRFAGRNTDKSSFLGASARAWSMGLFGLQKTAESIDRDSPPSPKSSDLGIITWADISGVPSNTGAGRYGRNGAVEAEGGAGPVTGTAATLVLAGQQLVAEDGVTIFELVADVTIPDTGSFVAVTPGSAGNLDAGDELTWLTPPTGCDPTVTLSTGLTGGEEEETIPHLFQRTKTRWQAPPKGGANVDYKEWAEALDGVGEAFVYERRGGTSTVHVVITAPGSGTDRIPSGTIIGEVQAALDLLKPTDVDELLILAPEMPSARRLTIRASAYLATGYEWDWDDTAGTWLVTNYNSGTLELTLDNPIPATLKAAIDAGDQPLIQVVSTSTGAPVVPEQVRVTAYDVTEEILTIASALEVDPSVGDAVHAGSYAAPFIAQAMLDHIDALGPSRESGLADSINQWLDVASIWAIGGAALAAEDDDEARLVARLADANGLTIAVGAGSPADEDFQPDDTYTLGPEMACAARCYATRAIGS